MHRRSLGASIFFKNYAHFAKSEEEEREAWVPIEEFSEGLGRYSFGESMDFQIHHDGTIDLNDLRTYDLLGSSNEIECFAQKELEGRILLFNPLLISSLNGATTVVQL